jgi:hypothetical protein
VAFCSSEQHDNAVSYAEVRNAPDSQNSRDTLKTLLYDEQVAGPARPGPYAGRAAESIL